MWKFKGIVAHEGPLAPHHPSHNGSRCDVCTEWENGEKTDEPLDVIAEDDPMLCVIHREKNGLLDEPGWIQFKCMAGQQKKLSWQVSQAKLKSHQLAPKCKCSHGVPRNCEDAIHIDEKNGNHK